MRASLPMYDLPAVRAATDRWWAGLARHLRANGVDAVPERLSRDPAPAWDAPDLLFSQTCGYPLTHALAGRVTPVCTPCYAAAGCNGARYSSLLVVAAGSDARALEQLRGGVCALNARDSHSGCNALRRMVAPLARGGRFFERVFETGDHADSLAAVAAGAADLCAVDAVTHALLARHEPGSLAGTRVLGHSPAAPGLPCIAGPEVDGETVGRMRRAVRAALADRGLRSTRAALLITGAEVVPLAAYDRILAMEREAQALGYPELR
ncbi:MAG: PhnD/SsuA/transferrin family substrate-binding protein [Halofilum sp. (in: g-proteobacteria)]|nr:PhnD/SsuA/transferrin family substrate-binding protein [Halofilum sp. (in: g-proteobacteria)]